MTSLKVVKGEGIVKSSRCKARKCLPSSGRSRNEAYKKYAAMTKDEAQRRRWTFYEAGKIVSARDLFDGVR